MKLFGRIRQSPFVGDAGNLSWARHAVFRDYWEKETLRPKGQNSVIRTSKNNGQKCKGGKLNGNITMDPRWEHLGVRR